MLKVRFWVVSMILCDKRRAGDNVSPKVSRWVVIWKDNYASMCFEWKIPSLQVVSFPFLALLPLYQLCQRRIILTNQIPFHNLEYTAHKVNLSKTVSWAKKWFYCSEPRRTTNKVIKTKRNSLVMIPQYKGGCTSDWNIYFVMRHIRVQHVVPVDTY